MKRQFAESVRKLGGTAKYSGGTEVAVMTEKTQHKRQIVSGRHFLTARKYQKKLLTIGYYAAKRLLGMKLNQPRTMYVHGITDIEIATKLQKEYEGIKLPFTVVFQ